MQGPTAAHSCGTGAGKAGPTAISPLRARRYVYVQAATIQTSRSEAYIHPYYEVRQYYAMAQRLVPGIPSAHVCAGCQVFLTYATVANCLKRPR